MTELADFLADLEADMARNRRAGSDICARVGQQSQSVQATLGPVLALVGCSGDVAAAPKTSLAPADRVRVARIIFLRFAVETRDPVWSSKALADALDAFLEIPGAQIDEALKALAYLWQNTPLTSTVANFAKAVALLCLTRYKASYRNADMAWLADAVVRDPIPPIAYLALRTLPLDLSAHARSAMLASLEGTPVAEEARTLLENDDANED
jgi:hypothetical protein